jgi:predicted metal-dependent enzyme (double-stranded beta helix superfamily)
LASNRFDRFVSDLDALVARQPAETEILSTGAALLRALVAVDDWLDPGLAQGDPERYQQYLLYCDPQARFSVVSFVWGPGQSTPIHNHTVWGLIGMLRGGEIDQRYRAGPDGRLEADGAAAILRAGDVATLSPATGDIHKVTNLHPDQVSVSIHAYGADIGRVSRSTFDLEGGRKTFVSGYSNVPARKAP